MAFSLSAYYFKYSDLSALLFIAFSTDPFTLILHAMLGRECPGMKHSRLACKQSPCTPLKSSGTVLLLAAQRRRPCVDPERQNLLEIPTPVPK